MNLALKYRIVEKIVNSEDELILNEINALLKLSESDFWPDLPESTKYAIEKAKFELDNKSGTPNDQIMREIKNQFLK